MRNRRRDVWARPPALALAGLLLTSSSLWACSPGERAPLTGGAPGSAPSAASSAQPGPDFLVNTAADDDGSVDGLLCSTTHCTLREAILAANGAAGAATIHFDVGAGQTITLTEALPALANTHGLTIDGQASGVAVDGARSFRLFRVSDGAVATLANLTLEHGNYTGGDCGAYPCGGGLKVDAGASATLIRSAILDCTTPGAAGGVFNAGLLAVVQSTLAGASSREGGALLNVGTATVTGSTLSGNTAAYGGGVLLANGGLLTIANSTLSGNSATGTGGSGGGGALDLYSGTATIASSTISGNTAVSPNQDRSGIWVEEDGSLTLRGSIVAGNGVANNFSRTGGTFTSQGYNLADAWNGMTRAASDLTGEPHLDPLADGGGPTRIMKLPHDSPAVDVMPCDGAPATDQLGTARPQGAGCDIGAYEFVRAQTSSALQSSLNPSLLGQPVTFTATVSPAAATGTVTFQESGGAALGEVPVASGRATLTTSSLGAGDHGVTAVYSGDAVYAASTSGALTQRVNLAPAMTSGGAATFTAGSASAFAITTTGFPAPAVSVAGALPAGVTLADHGDGTATLAGTPAAGSGGVYPLTLTAANGVGTDATQAFTLTVHQAPALASAASATFTVGTAGSFLVTATGFPAPAVSVAGALPAGVALTDHGDGTATLAGTPAAGSAGVYGLTLTAASGVAPEATQAFTLTISDPAIEPGPPGHGSGGGGCASSPAGGAGTALLALLFWLQRRSPRRRPRGDRPAAELQG